MKKKVILCVSILMVLMTGCFEREEIENTEITVSESAMATKEYVEDLSAILGKWTLDGVKTQEELEKVGTGLREEFGTAVLEYGAGAELREDGYFSFHEGISVGGEGTYSYENGLVTVDYELYVDCVEKMEIVLYPKVIDDKDYLVLKMYGCELYLIREE